MYAKTAEKIYVGKRKGEHAIPQSELSKMLRNQAMRGRNVVRLKGGDPLIFGRGADEIDYLRSYRIDVKVIPGISSATGIPSSLGIPLTARGVSSSVAFLSGHEEGEKVPKSVEIPKVDTIIFLMGLTKLSIIVQSLQKAGWKIETPMMVISKGTRQDERIVQGAIGNIESLVKQENLEPPALMIVGEVVKFYRPAKSSKENILYLGTNPEKYTSLGPLVYFPMIEIKEARLPKKEAGRLLKALYRYQAIMLTSRFAVKYFMDILHKENYSMKKLKSIDFIVIGQETADQLREYNIEPKITSNIETSEGLLDELSRRYPLKGKRILFPRSSLPNPFLKNELRKKGASVKEITVYENKKPSKKALPRETISKIFFTSPSTVRNFLADYHRIPKGWQILSKGPLTSRALRDFGYESEVLIYD